MKRFIRSSTEGSKIQKLTQKNLQTTADMI